MMSTQTVSSKSSTEDVWLSSAETRAWLQLSHDELDDLVSRGVLKSTPSRVNLKPIFRGSDVAKIAAKRSQRVPA
jgi:hypothetical protein